jgi:hypothetical protein
MPKAKREASQYAPLARFLEIRGCNPKARWWAGKGQSIKLDVDDPRSRTPDVVGAERVGDSWRTHIIEAKRDVGGGAAINLGRAQLRTLQPFGDLLYLSLDGEDWRARTPKQQNVLRQQLKEDGIGLLVVNGRDVQVEEKPTQNVNVPRRDELLDWLEVDPQRTRRFDAMLDRPAAEAAAKTTAFVGYCLGKLRPIFKTMFPRARTPREQETFWFDLSLENPGFFMWAESAADGLWTEGDPFGWHLRDGVPSIWVWCDLDGTQVPPEETNVVDGLCWYCFGESKSGAGATYPWTAGNLAVLERSGFTEDRTVGTRIALGGKTLEDIEGECRRILTVFKGPHIRHRRRARR